MENLNDTERVKAEEYWARMQEEGKTNDEILRFVKLASSWII